MKKIIFIRTLGQKASYFDATLERDDASQRDKVIFIENGEKQEVHLENYVTREIGGISMIFAF